MLFPVPVRLVGQGVAKEVSQQCQHPWPAASTTQGNGCSTCTLRGNLSQFLRGHILPACASHPSVCGCLISKCLKSQSSMFSSFLISLPNVYLHAHAGRQRHPSRRCWSLLCRAALQAAQAHLNPSKSGEKCCI